MNINTCIVGVFLILSINLVLGSSEDLIVRIKSGLLQGSFMETKNGRQFLGFMGIRYAKPPLGELRFQPPVPIEDWEGIKFATEIHDICIQLNTFIRINVIEGTEDCLFLNVYTPKIDKDNLLPVMMYIHGGGFQWGTGNKILHGPEHLLDKDVVLVIINYRLGPFGFFTTGDEVVPGNMGLKDQNLALKWVKENIVHFGGDPNSVMIFGESAGAGSTHLQMLSPLSKGLFHAVISQSGTAVGQWALFPLQRGVNISKKLAKIFKCPTENSEDMIKCLRDVDAKDIIEEQKQFLEWDVDPPIVFAPVIEPKHDGAFIYETAENSLKMGLGSDVPWITGINTEEGAIRSAAICQIPNLLNQLNEKFEEVAHLPLFRDRSKNTDIVVQEMRKFYFGNAEIDSSQEENITNMYTDVYFSWINKAINLHKKYLKSPVYSYLFGFRGSMSFSKLFGGGTEKNFGVCHSDDLIYLFPVYDALFPGEDPTTDDKRMIEVMTTLWTNFAKYKNPTPEGSSVIWTPVESSENEYLRIIDHQDMSMDKNMNKERMEFWNQMEAYMNDRGIKAQDDLIVRVKNGAIQGTVMETKNRRKILGFTGIPYAKPPIGDLRFQPPIPADKWDGVLPSNENHASCHQSFILSISMEVPNMSEDCLFLNVYTPQIHKDELLPVMVFIHGGAFRSGSADKLMSGPGILLDKDIVLVAMNYRLGPLGFLATGDKVVPGNMGMKDQTLALKWVKENIINFGGDPNSVTIFGVSAGGVSTHLQMLSPLSKGLFHASISQSGTAFCQWAIQPLNRVADLSKQLAKLLNCPAEDTKIMVECLRKVDANDINDKQADLAEWDADPIIIFGPTIEPDNIGAFMTDTPENVLKSGKGSDVPWINGITTEEGVLRSAGLLTNTELLKEYNEIFYDIAHLIFFRNKGKKTDELARRVREFYFGKSDIDASKEKELTNMYSDAFFSHGSHKAVTLHKKYLRQPVYNYLFGYRGTLSLSVILSGSVKDFGVCHGDDMMYFFPMFDAFMPGLQVTEEEHKMSDMLVTLWTKFAKYRNPTPKGSDFIWNPVETKGNEYLRINGVQSLVMEKDMFKGRMDFWDSLELLLDDNSHVKYEL